MKRISKSEVVTRLIMIGIGYLIDGDEKMAAEAFESADDIRKILTYDKAIN